jgi:RNA polymerase sigma factor (sigma-70 family)
MGDWEQDFQLLLQRVGEGSQEAAWELVEQYGERIRRAVRRLLHERMRGQFDSLDFVQLVWKSFFSDRATTARFQQPEELVAYLATMARNKVGTEARRLLRTQKHDVRREVPLHSQAPEGLLSPRGDAPLDLAVARETYAQLLQGQPAHYRRILEMKLQGYSCREIADALGLAECTVRRFLNKLAGEIA